MPFSHLGLHPDLLRGVRELGFTRPTTIQEAAIPPALAGRDVLAGAMTGSGKTAAFLLPILHRLAGKPRGTTRALVLTPTRELAAQIAEHLEALAVHTPLSGASVLGDVGMEPQEHAFRRGVDVIIATPGRLLDHFRFPYARLQGLEVLVLDEADRMLDMGFLPDIRRILRHLPAKRQTAVLLGHAAAAHRHPRAPDAARPGHHRHRAEGGPRCGDHARRVPGVLGAEVGAPRGAAEAR
jgi:ATP-dependent RNA helicase RhlE